MRPNTLDLQIRDQLLVPSLARGALETKQVELVHVDQDLADRVLVDPVVGHIAGHVVEVELGHLGRLERVAVPRQDAVVDQVQLLVRQRREPLDLELVAISHPVHQGQRRGLEHEVGVFGLDALVQSHDHELALLGHLGLALAVLEGKRAVSHGLILELIPEGRALVMLLGREDRLHRSMVVGRHELFDRLGRHGLVALVALLTDEVLEHPFVREREPVPRVHRVAQDAQLQALEPFHVVQLGEPTVHEQVVRDAQIRLTLLELSFCGHTHHTRRQHRCQHHSDHQNQLPHGSSFLVVSRGSRDKYTISTLFCQHMNHQICYT